MAKKNTKSRYWVDDNSILPEIVITPQGNYPVLDEAGNPARTVGAIQDINPNAHIYERVNTQPFMDDYIEGETNAAANQRADALDAQVVPHMGDFVSAAAKPLDALMPSRWVGLLDKDYDGLSAVDRFSRLFDENNKGLFINDNPYGLFSKRYAEEHPYWTMAGNTAFDVVSTPFIWNGANKAYNAGKTAYSTGRDAVSLPVKITEENAAAMTPEQWTAAQDVAIARGDMVEAQRLRDLHFQVSAPNTVASVNGQPLQLYHGTDATFNAFDISKYGSTDGGTFGRGIYTTPVKEYAELYGKNNMPLYMKLDNPRDYRNSSIGDLLAEKIAFGDDFATGIGIDGVIGRPSWKGFKGLEEYVSHNPRNIKSSLPITHDDNGVRIPLGERDNFFNPDIRYGFIPWLLGTGTTAATAYGASQQDNNVKAYGGLLDMANKFKDGGSKNDYNTWKKKIKDYKGIIVDSDDTYDYYNFFKDNPQMAWDMLNDNPEAHFIDKYKTPNHPTYSNESIYSRAPYIQGGIWNEYSPTVMGQKWNYALSPSQVNSNWDVERTINYLADAENEGAYVTDSNGRYPIVDGTVLGGTLTPVTITPNNHSQGGSLKQKFWNDLSMKEKSEMIRVAVNEGITDIGEIRNRYNEYAESFI